MKKNIKSKLIMILSFLIFIILLLSLRYIYIKISTNILMTKENDSLIGSEKLEKITYMGTTIQFTKDNGLEEFENEYKKLTGIELEFIKPDHNSYYENVNLAFSTGKFPDALELGTEYYPSYAYSGVLWDMTETWENSELKASNTIDESYVEAIKIDDKLYGFPMVKGGGVVTYVRQDWLDNLKLKVPSNYTEFIEMLMAFTYNDPDGNGKNDTYGITSAGLINSVAPYTMYLREFYQDAEPGIKLVNDEYVDGMLEPSMIYALRRIKDAYNWGLIDKDVFTNRTSSAREKFYLGKAGTFSYWAGFWNVNLQNMLDSRVSSGVIKPIPAIEETYYMERLPLPMAITIQAENPEYIFKNLIEFSHDGDKGQMLFTYGVEGFSYEYANNGLDIIMLKNKETNVPFQKAYFDPEISITDWDDPLEFAHASNQSLSVLRESSVVQSYPLMNNIINAHLTEVKSIKVQIISEIITDKISIEEGIAKYKKETENHMKPILESLNE